MNRVLILLSTLLLCFLFAACNNDAEEEFLEPERHNDWKFIKGKINGEPLTIGFDDFLSGISEWGVIDTCNVYTKYGANWEIRAWIDKGKSISLNIGSNQPIIEGNYSVLFSDKDPIPSPFVGFARNNKGLYCPSETPAMLHVEKVYYKDWSELPFVIGRLEGKFIRYDDPTDVIYLEDVEFQLH